MDKAVPPPLPVPKRSLTPPAQRARSESGTFTLESKTPVKSRDVAEYTALISVFDELSHEQRGDLTEFLFVYKSLSEEQRKRVIEQAIAEVFP